jgi:N-formylglutamate deformylase
MPPPRWVDGNIPLALPVQAGQDCGVIASPVLLHAPVRQTTPVVFASAHSGRHYPDDFVAAARLGPLALRRSEDAFVDELFADAPSCGAPLLAATFARACCDPNREAWELDPGMFDEALPDWVNSGSARVQAGLGTIARVVASGEAIYGRKLRFAEARQRVRDYWQPWHDALAELIAQTMAAFGRCLLIDCHSMPSAATPAADGRRGRMQPDFVLGDAHGTSCAASVTALVEEMLRGRGYRTVRNEPYAGGYITRHYGRPRLGVHALQIEVARHLYMDEARIEPQAGFAGLRRDIGALIGAIAREAPTLIQEGLAHA